MTDETRIPVPGTTFEKFGEGELRVEEVLHYSKRTDAFNVRAEDGLEYEITYVEDEERWEAI